MHREEMKTYGQGRGDVIGVSAVVVDTVLLWAFYVTAYVSGRWPELAKQHRFGRKQFGALLVGEHEIFIEAESHNSFYTSKQQQQYNWWCHNFFIDPGTCVRDSVRLSFHCNTSCKIRTLAVAIDTKLANDRHHAVRWPLTWRDVQHCMTAADVWTEPADTTRMGACSYMTVCDYLCMYMYMYMYM